MDITKGKKRGAQSNSTVMKRKPSSSSLSSSSAPNPRKLQVAKRKYQQRGGNDRMRIDLDADGPDQPSSSLTSPPSSSDSEEDPAGGNARKRINQKRERQLRQPKRFPLNPDDQNVAEWLQSDTINPYVKLTRKQMKRMKPCSRIYLKVAKIDLETKQIQKLLPGGTLVRNEFPVFCMLQGINSTRPFSMQFPACQFYIRKLDLPKITEEYEKNKIYQAVLQQG